MNKFVYDTLTSKGVWSQKRVMIYASFISAFIYAFIPLFKDGFDVKEFVFIGFLGIGGFTIFRTQKKNENEPSGDTYEEETNIKTTIANSNKEEL